jgi:hypothetical protein
MLRILIGIVFGILVVIGLFLLGRHTGQEAKEKSALSHLIRPVESYQVDAFEKNLGHPLGATVPLVQTGLLIHLPDFPKSGTFAYLDLLEGTQAITSLQLQGSFSLQNDEVRVQFDGHSTPATAAFVQGRLMLHGLSGSGQEKQQTECLRQILFLARNLKAIDLKDGDRQSFGGVNRTVSVPREGHCLLIGTDERESSDEIAVVFTKDCRFIRRSLGGQTNTGQRFLRSLQVQRIPTGIHP